MNKVLIVSCLSSAFLLFGCGQEVKMVEVEPPNIMFVRKAQTEHLRAKALDIHSAEMQGVTFTYSSENPGVADVDADGTVRPKGNGSTAVVARTPSGVTGESLESLLSRCAYPRKSSVIRRTS